MEFNGRTLPKRVRKVLDMLTNAGYEAWCVGGCVRDLLLGRRPHDWDVTTSALPEQVMEVFGRRVFPTGIRHGTVTVMQGMFPVEVTTFRVDGDYADHRRPTSVTFTSSLDRDLERRDFTVNAMALSLEGELRDPLGGQADLKRRMLRCIGNPDLRFQEDAFRILRGMRFSATLGFAIHPDTAAAFHRYHPALRDIARERIQMEMEKLLPGRKAPAVLREFSDVVGGFWPEILPLIGMDQQNPDCPCDVWEHSLRTLEAVHSQDPVLCCAALLHDVGKPAVFTLDEDGYGRFEGHGAAGAALVEEMLRRLRFSKVFTRNTGKLIAFHDVPLPQKERGIRRLRGELGLDGLRRLFALQRADAMAHAPEAREALVRDIDRAEGLLDALLARKACSSVRQLAVNGDDLVDLGLTGPAVGAALTWLLDQVAEEALPNKKKILLEAIRQGGCQQAVADA